VPESSVLKCSAMQHSDAVLEELQMGQDSDKSDTSDDADYFPSEEGTAVACIMSQSNNVDGTIYRFMNSEGLGNIADNEEGEYPFAIGEANTSVTIYRLMNSEGLGNMADKEEGEYPFAIGEANNNDEMVHLHFGNAK